MKVWIPPGYEAEGKALLSKAYDGTREGYKRYLDSILGTTRDSHRCPQCGETDWLRGQAYASLNENGWIGYVRCENCGYNANIATYWRDVEAQAVS